MKYEDFKAAVIAAAQSEGLTDYELYYVSDESTSVDTFGHEVKSFTDATSGGAYSGIDSEWIKVGRAPGSVYYLR